jgi:hypothetical protein
MNIFYIALLFLATTSASEPKGDYIGFNKYSQDSDGVYRVEIITRVSGKLSRKYYRIGETVSGFKLTTFKEITDSRPGAAHGITEFMDISELTLIETRTKKKIVIQRRQLYELSSSNKAVEPIRYTLRVPLMAHG